MNGSTSAECALGDRPLLASPPATRQLVYKQFNHHADASGNANMDLANMDLAQSDIRISSREDVLYLLAEAAAVEHNLMCCYLYAAFSLKQSVDEGLTAEQAAALA